MKTILTLTLLGLFNHSLAFASEYLVKENLWLTIGDEGGTLANISLPFSIDSIDGAVNKKGQKAEIAGLVFHSQVKENVSIAAPSLDSMKTKVMSEVCSNKYSHSTSSDFYWGFPNEKTEKNQISLGSLSFEHGLGVSKVSFYYTVDGANRTYMTISCSRNK